MGANRGDRHAAQIHRAKRRSSPSYGIKPNRNAARLARYAARRLAALIAAATPDCLRIVLIFSRASRESRRIAARY